MMAYLLLFSLPAWHALTLASRPVKSDIAIDFRWKIQILLLLLIIGLRHETGGDWFLYEEDLKYISSLDFQDVMRELRKSDPAYAFLSWISTNVGGLHFVNFVCGAIFTIGLITFCRNQPDPWLALSISIPYLVIVVAMGYTRQGVAIGLAMLGLVALAKNKTFEFLLWLSMAATFHKSAVILIPMAFFCRARTKWTAILGIATVGTLAFILLLQESVERLIAGYLGDSMESSGALVRIMMNALPAALFLLLRSKFLLSKSTKSFWTWMAYGALLFIPALAISPSSTAVDRVALYWIPIQIFVWSRLPTVLSVGPRSERMMRISIVTYSLAILLVWLLLGVHAYNWLPYRFYPLELIGNSLFR